MNELQCTIELVAAIISVETGEYICAYNCINSRSITVKIIVVRWLAEQTVITGTPRGSLPGKCHHRWRTRPFCREQMKLYHLMADEERLERGMLYQDHLGKLLPEQVLLPLRHPLFSKFDHIFFEGSEDYLPSKKFQVFLEPHSRSMIVLISQCQSE